MWWGIWSWEALSRLKCHLFFPIIVGEGRFLNYVRQVFGSLFFGWLLFLRSITTFPNRPDGADSSAWIRMMEVCYLTNTTIKHMACVKGCVKSWGLLDLCTLEPHKLQWYPGTTQNQAPWMREGVKHGLANLKPRWIRNTYFLPNSFWDYVCFREDTYPKP